MDVCEDQSSDVLNNDIRTSSSAIEGAGQTDDDANALAWF